ncbi:TonB-dependent siderophore receptor [Pseudomonas sp. 148P]|uniref:TonB-dependent siderophore receptor n=1 Tax=Pseudomonas ulcerans TaxID=3115852 RepID=A0ABU7HYZ0_9PSED|nr:MULTISPECIES: TonB-dependent siderophore receptor [unclassified Pseudomonas]MEE1925335.1 TonB-dependent siderophore receptor [Pseudomonas sp. 147P]MEE1936789.1 TonB-dependent siderophore receptor [Pseudomonas sp. 148P]
MSALPFTPTAQGLRRAIAAAAFGLAIALPAQAEPVSVDIPAKTLASALADLGTQTALQIIYSQDTVSGLRSHGVSGQMEPEQALRQMLQGTGIAYQLDGNHVTLQGKREDAAIALPSTSIAGQAYSSVSPDDGYVAKRASAGSKTDTPIIETPYSVSVVTREQIKAQQPKTVSQALRYTPGINTELAGPQFVTDQMTIRGFQQGTGRMLRDGTRTFLPEFLGWDAPEPYGLERVEVLRGASSVLYGASDPGGQINLVSKRPTTEPLHEIQLQAGNHDYRQVAFDFGDALDEEGRWSYRLTGLFREADAQAEHITNRREYLAPAISFRPDADTELTVLAEYQKQTGNFANPLPAQGTVFHDPRGRLDRDTYVGDSAHDYMTNEKTSLGYVFERHLDEVWTLRQNVRYSDYRQSSAEIALFGPAGDQYSRYSDQRKGDGRLFTLDTQVQANFATGAVEHTLLTGVDYNNGKFDQAQSLDFILQSFDVFKPVYGQPLDTVPVSAADYEQKLSQTGLYLQDQLKIGQWVFLLGGRYDWASNQKDDRTPQTQKDEKFSGRAGIVYLFDNGLAPYASYSESFLPVMGVTASNAQLQPEVGKQYEVGLKYEPPGANSLYTLAVFDLTKQNATENVGGSSRQDGEVRSQGVELEARSEVTSGLNLIGTYTWNDVEVTRSDLGRKGNTPFRIPEHMASAWADYRVQGGPLEGLRLGGGARYVGSTFGDLDNSFKVDSYVVVDALVAYELGKLDASLDGVELALNATNLLDEKYVAGCYSTMGCQYGQQRTLYGSVTYNW